MANANNGATDTGLSEKAADADTEEVKAALDALEKDDTSWDDGEEVKSRFEAEDEDDEEATDSFDEEAETDDVDVESEDTDTEDAESEDSEENDQADETEDSDVTEEADTTDLEAERKRHNDEMAKARIAERKAQQEAEALRKERQEATIQQYLEEAGEDEIERARRENNVEQYRIQEERIGLNHERLQSGIERALTSIDLFRTGSAVVKEELANSLDDFEQKFVEFDKHGRPLRIKVDPATGKQADVVQYLQRKADSIKRIRGDGATQQVKRKSNEKTRTLTPPVRAPKKAKTDPDLDAFDEEARK